MFSFNNCRFAFALAAACNAVTFAKESKVDLGFAEDYVILAKTGISTVPDSAITGDIAVSPIAAASMTGFSMTKDLSDTFSTSNQITGQAFAADYKAPIPSQLTTAVSAMETAYTNAAGRVNPNAARIDLGGGLLGGDFGGATAPLTPGVYTFGSNVQITSNIFFEGTGLGPDEGATDVFIIQIAGNLLQAANYNVELSNGALASNIFWQVAGSAKVGAGAHMEGILLIKTDILFETQSSLNGRVFSQTACNLQKATLTQPAASQGLGEETQATSAASSAAAEESSCGGISCVALAVILVVVALVATGVGAAMLMKHKSASKPDATATDGQEVALKQETV